MSDKNTTKIKLAVAPGEIRACHTVIAQLRPHLDEEMFLAQVDRQQRASGYQLVYLEEDGVVHAVAGFRIQEMLFSGRHLYVDDLVTDESRRSAGYGSKLIDWLVDHARQQRCKTLELDSGVHRAAAHRFYFRKGLTIESFHFRLDLEE